MRESERALNRRFLTWIIFTSSFTEQVVKHYGTCREWGTFEFVIARDNIASVIEQSFISSSNTFYVVWLSHLVEVIRKMNFELKIRNEKTRVTCAYIVVNTPQTLWWEFNYRIFKRLCEEVSLAWNLRKMNILHLPKRRTNINSNSSISSSETFYQFTRWNFQQKLSFFRKNINQTSTWEGANGGRQRKKRAW